MSDTKKETGATAPVSREQRVEELVAMGYSRTFAEAYIPMTEVHRRRLGLTVNQYESAFSIINKRVRK